MFSLALTCSLLNGHIRFTKSGGVPIRLITPTIYSSSKLIPPVPENLLRREIMPVYCFIAARAKFAYNKQTLLQTAIRLKGNMIRVGVHGNRNLFLLCSQRRKTARRTREATEPFKMAGSHNWSA